MSATSMRQAARAVNQAGSEICPDWDLLLGPGTPFLLTMKRVLSLGFGVALLAGSLYGLGHSLFLAEEIPVGVLSAACFYGVLAAYWLWADLTGYANSR